MYIRNLRHIVALRLRVPGKLWFCQAVVGHPEDSDGETHGSSDSMENYPSDIVLMSCHEHESGECTVIVRFDLPGQEGLSRT